MTPESRPTRLLLAPVGAGKTESVIQRLVDVKRERPFARIWVLLSGDRQISDFRQRLMAADPKQRVYFNVEFFNFYRLYNRLLEMVGQPQRRLDDIDRLRLLRSILDDLQSRGELPIYGGIAPTPGFARIIADLIYELKQTLVTPEDFLRAAQTPRDTELARIYAVYQNTLVESNLVDREGEGWVALMALYGYDELGRDVDVLLVDGYDQFTPLQARLLTLLATRAGDTLVTLTTVPGREQTIGRRFQATFERLKTTHEVLEHSLVLQPPPRMENRDPALTALVERIFLSQQPPASVGEAIRFVEAPSPAAETAAVLRRVKRLLLDGCSPDSIVITVRDWSLYGAHFGTVNRAYRLPLAVQWGEPLIENPALTALFNLLDLPASHFRRRGLLDALSSPYFDLPGLKTAAGAIERLSRQQLITDGRDAWLTGLELQAGVEIREDAGDDEEAPPSLPPVDWLALRDALATFFDAVTPPSQADPTTYVTWIERLIGRDPDEDPDEALDSEDETAEAAPAVYTLNMLAQLKRAAGDDGLIVARDLAAMHRFKSLLAQIISTQRLMEALRKDASVEWPQFLADLKAAVVAARIDRAPDRAGRVLVTSVTDARGLAHDHVFILGLAEGVFPALLPEDPLYLDSERRVLAEAGVAVQPRGERTDDDGLFYELISLARRTLTFSRPYVNDGQLWMESHLWRAAQAVYADASVTRYRLGTVVDVDEAVTTAESALAVAQALNHMEIEPTAAQGYNWLLEQHADLWRHIHLGWRVETLRMSGNHGYDRYSGRLQTPALIDQIAERLRRQAWSASRLNEFGQCGFRYFAGRLLKLEPLEEPEDGADQLQLGVLYHEILEKTYGYLAERRLPLVPEHVDEALAILRDTAVSVLDDAPARLGFRASPLWTQEKGQMVRRLEALVRDDFAPKSALNKLVNAPRVPYRQEVPFGAGDGVIWLSLGNDREPVKLVGKIDRLDRAGDAVLVIDYKSGSSKMPVEDLALGRSFQLMLYVLVAEQLLLREADGPTQVIGGAFWSIRNRSLLGKLMLDEEGWAAINEGRAHLARYLTRGQKGDFAAHASKLENGRCASYCDFHHLCRAANMNPRKSLD